MQLPTLVKFCPNNPVGTTPAPPLNRRRSSSFMHHPIITDRTQLRPTLHANIYCTILHSTSWTDTIYPTSKYEKKKSCFRNRAYMFTSRSISMSSLPNWFSCSTLHRTLIHHKLAITPVSLHGLSDGQIRPAWPFTHVKTRKISSSQPKFYATLITHQASLNAAGLVKTNLDFPTLFTTFWISTTQSFQINFQKSTPPSL